MNIINIINKKRLKETLTDEEIKYVIDGYLNGSIKDYQMSSLLMAILLNDMDNSEIYSLTKYMALSGDMLDLSPLGDNVVDKHSTGGVGDKTTIIIAPIVAACGVKVAKMSGRGLGHTGGTIDKLESIPGFTVNLTKEEFLKFSIGENSLLTSYKLSRYKFVLESDNLLEYTVKHYKLVENKLNKKIDKLTKENNKLKKKNKSLTNQTHDNKIKKIFSTFR